MNWIPLEHYAQLQELNEKSKGRPQVIFKHSIRCGVSSVAKNRLEKSLNKPEILGNADFYYLDLINYRSISKKIEELYNISHESPQVLVIKNGECVYDESHMSITMNDILEVC